MRDQSAAADVAAGQIMAHGAQHNDWAEQFGQLNLNQGPPNAWADEIAGVSSQLLMHLCLCQHHHAVSCMQ